MLRRNWIGIPKYLSWESGTLVLEPPPNKGVAVEIFEVRLGTIAAGEPKEFANGNSWTS